VESKRCGKCEVVKEAKEFGIDRRWNKLRSYCKSCCRLKEREYRKQNPEKIRASNIRSTYKVSMEEAYRLMSVSNCNICDVELTKSIQHVRCKTDQVIDHCHTTGRVRGVLCSGCNLALGHAKDDPRVLNSMINYLKNK